jgi:endonuclease YncB( thermonuclease family)
VHGYHQNHHAVNGIRLLVYVLLLCASSLAQGEEFIARVIAVLDGDTVLVLPESGGRHPAKVRLAEIDAPEKQQAFGEASRRSLSGMVLGRQVKVAVQAVDRYGRMVAHLDLDGLDVNAEQIRRGMAWEYSHYHRNHALVALQEEARRVPRGLWVSGNPMPPWEWRKLHPNALPVQSDIAESSPAMQPAPSCGNKKHCAEMTSCEEARYYFTQCGIQTLDGDGDGVPCEKLCATAVQK